MHFVAAASWKVSKEEAEEKKIKGGQKDYFWPTVRFSKNEKLETKFLRHHKNKLQHIEK